MNSIRTTVFNLCVDGLNLFFLVGTLGFAELFFTVSITVLAFQRIAIGTSRRGF
jgi:hypothetical protein